MRPRVPNEPSSDADYFYMGGTSMSAPLVAGCAAVLRETLVKNGISSPSAALIKALLINGAVELAERYCPSEAGASPNDNSGWGAGRLGRLRDYPPAPTPTAASAMVGHSSRATKTHLPWTSPASRLTTNPNL